MTNTINPTSQLDVLKKHFPQCFDKNGTFIIDKLQETLQTSGIELTKEGYSMNWLGKSYARLLSYQPVQTLLKANIEHNALTENANSKNLLIKGDNLEVLKHLMGAYSEKVKMIYIDPPYNTGSDGFVYQDDRKFTKEQLSSLAGIDEEEAARILEFTQSKSNSHSAWLTFMYPRLYLARQLLRDDGVIFISIDDNEQAQLKLLCDEIFGEENFIANVVWNHTKQSKNDEPFFSRHHNQIHCYLKNSSSAEGFKFDRTKEDNRNYSNPDNDPRGEWRSGDVRSPSFRNTLKYQIQTPSGKIIQPPENGWRWSLETLLDKIKNGEIIFSADESKIIRKIYLAEQDGRTPENLWLSDFAGTTRDATNELKELFGSAPFDTPKPSLLIKRLSKLGSDENAIILDFFAGSGTTAHAVMQLNAEDNGNRQFICVQIDEPTDAKSEAFKAGYKTIYDITAERIKRAAAKIKAENPNAACDFGFQQFATTSIFNQYTDEPDELTENLSLFDASKLSHEDRQNLMLTWQVQDGIALNTTLSPIDLAGYTAYQGGHFLYFIEPNIAIEAIIALLEQLDVNWHWKKRRYIFPPLLT